MTLLISLSPSAVIGFALIAVMAFVWFRPGSRDL